MRYTEQHYKALRAAELFSARNARKIARELDEMGEPDHANVARRQAKLAQAQMVHIRLTGYCKVIERA